MLGRALAAGKVAAGSGAPSPSGGSTLTNRDRVAFGCYLVPALTLLAFGVRYLTASQFMPYHAAALQRQWTDLLPNEQGVMLAALRGGGGGFLIGGVAIGLLLLIPFRRGELWAHRAVPGLVLLCASSALFTSLTLARMTPGSPPWPLALVMAFLAGIGFILAPGRPR
jgi:hypothetical protein